MPLQFLSSGSRKKSGYKLLPVQASEEIPGTCRAFCKTLSNHSFSSSHSLSCLRNFFVAQLFIFLCVIIISFRHIVYNSQFLQDISCQNILFYYFLCKTRNFSVLSCCALIFSLPFSIFTFSFDIPYFFLCILPNILQNNFLNSENPVAKKEKVRNFLHFCCALSGFYSLFPCFCLTSQQSHPAYHTYRLAFQPGILRPLLHLFQKLPWNMLCGTG